MWCKAEFKKKIILICWFAAQQAFIIIIKVDQKVQKNSIYLKYNFFFVTL